MMGYCTYSSISPNFLRFLCIIPFLETVSLLILNHVDFEIFKFFAPWILFTSWILMQLKNLNSISQQNEKILELLQKNDEEDSILDSEYQLPYFEDSESSSGYTTDLDVDFEWELYKILRSPDGPVPPNQIYLTFTCQKTDLYVKAVVDQNHSKIHILTYEKSNGIWDWKETKCVSCIEKVRKVLADGGCTVPFAMDLEDFDEESDEDEDDEDDVISVIEMPIRRNFDNL